MSFHGNDDDPSSAQPVSNNPEPKPDGKPKPVSARKLAANRANAARSTGPCTPEGKARVSMNAVRHGLASHAALLPGEDPDELEALARAYHDDLRPRGALEQDLVARIVGISWRLRRVTRAEEALWQAEDEDRVHTAEVRTHVRGMFNAAQLPWESDEAPSPRSAARFVAGQFGQRGTSPLERLAVYEQRLGRALHAAIRELNMLRKLRDARGNEDDHAPHDVERIAKTQAAVGAAPGDTNCVQNKPTDPDAPRKTESSEVGIVSEAASPTSLDALDVSHGTGAHIVQNKPTAGPPTSVGGLGDVTEDPKMPPPVDAPDARPHPPSP
jgi:hypothetical protein